MAKIKLTIEYDGTAYVGWQLQPNGISIQQRVEEALQQLSGETIRVHSSGRTDAGVHALGMVCHLETARDLPPSAWREGLNRFLPADIVVRCAEPVDTSFHARFSARGKCYRYTVLRSTVRSPLQMRTSWLVRQVLDLTAIREAASLLVGEHDFAAFRTSGCAAATTRRQIFSLDVNESENLLLIDVCGSGFLKNMVRMLVGTLIEVGRGKRPVADVSALLSCRAAVSPALTAPPQGLCLLNVYY
jgi:tRNA pseudouridine38-40 synthase